MESQFVSSAAKTNLAMQVANSKSIHHQLPIEHGVFSASQFKGVVGLPNGHWGAELFTNNRPIWLGSFNSEVEAAAAYDSVSVKLCNGDQHRNFPWSNITIHEPKFQSQFSLVEILSMIKNGSYPMRFTNFLISQVNGISKFPNLQGVSGTGLRLLFQKELTPSDVSKLNRLVVPKRYAVKYFPPVPETVEQDGGSVSAHDAELEFFDRSMVLWSFRYCYWKSSQSYVFTRGWNRFAKEKGLRAKDRVIFSTYESGDQARRVIDVAYSDQTGVEPVAEVNLEDSGEIESGVVDEEKHYGEMTENRGNFSVGAERKKSVRLFGVEIFG